MCGGFTNGLCITLFHWEHIQSWAMLHQVILVKRSADPEAQEAAIFGETVYYLFRLLFIITISHN
jgi:hypothetical protein